MDSYFFTETEAAPGAPLLFLFHGTGGDENDLVPLGQQLLPAARIVSPRGDVSEGGALRFFRRTGEGRYDMADLTRATGKMRSFVAATIDRLKPSATYGLGFSNGANILASVLFEEPALFDRAVLMHPLIPFLPPPQRGLFGLQILVTAGRRDPIAPAAVTEALATYLEEQGAKVDMLWHDGGHELRREELAAAAKLLRDGEQMV